MLTDKEIEEGTREWLARMDISTALPRRVKSPKMPRAPQENTKLQTKTNKCIRMLFEELFKKQDKWYMSLEDIYTRVQMLDPDIQRLEVVARATSVAGEMRQRYCEECQSKDLSQDGHENFHTVNQPILVLSVPNPEGRVIGYMGYEANCPKCDDDSKFINDHADMRHQRARAFDSSARNINALGNGGTNG